MGWLSSGDCSTAPNIMLTFSGVANTLHNQMLHEQYSLTTCGTNLFPMHGGCCFSNLAKSYFSGYASLVQREVFREKSNFPVAANGAAYCHIKAVNPNSLYGLNEVWIKADGACVENFYSCKPTGELSRYSGSGCTQQSSSIRLNPSASSFDFADMGNVEGEFVTISNGYEHFTWTAYIPAVTFVYRYNTLLENIALVCYIGAIMVSLSVLAYSIHKFIKTKSTYLTIFVLSQLLWVLWIAMDFGYLNIIFPTSASNLDEWYAEIAGCMFNLASLTTVWNTAAFIVGFKNITGHLRSAMFGTIVTIHIALAGGNYTVYLYLTNAQGSIWQSWHQILPLWTLCMFIFNTVPSFLITIPLIKNLDYLRKMSTWAAIKRLLITDKIFSALVCLQLTNTLIALIVYTIQQATQLLGSDRNYYCMNGVFALVYAVHAAINCLFLEHIRSILQSSRMKSSSLKSQKPTINAPFPEMKTFKLEKPPVDFSPESLHSNTENIVQYF
ncbi:hypothetical protein HDV06_005888 [Boothiomyces sp. JEL0866]|nr:hypothetical protein HDV06_005888 [Boothiomyces sp. JEL0866]